MSYLVVHEFVPTSEHQSTPQPSLKKKKQSFSHQIESNSIIKMKMKQMNSIIKMETKQMNEIKFDHKDGNEANERIKGVGIVHTFSKTETREARAGK